MNGYLNSYAYPDPREFPGPFKMFGKIGQMNSPSPAGIWVVIDEREDSINNGNFTPSMEGIDPLHPAQFGWINWPGNYHNGASGLFFADGHSEIHRWLDPRTTPPRGKLSLGSLGANIPTPNNQDCYWLGVRTTSLR
jgi:prepilin-type processing-associated H-X9-DG protein